MLFDVQAALAEILAAPRCDIRDKYPGNARASQASRLSQSQPAEPPAPATVLPFPPPPGVLAPSRDEGGPFRHGASPSGSPRTWTGRIVRLDEWRSLSAWDRYGPDGRLFCSLCRAWVVPAGCPHCNGGAA